MNGLRDLESSGERLCTTPVSAFELYSGAWRSSKIRQNIAAVTELLGDLQLLEMDLDASMRAGLIHAMLARSGLSIGVEDEVIAGIALRHNESLVTRNLTHFQRIQGLTVRSW